MYYDRGADFISTLRQKARELPEGKGEAAEGIHQRPGARIPGLLQKMQQTVTGLWRAIIGIERQRP